ncbi:MAG: phosphohistidine phosphatase SixA [Anaerolineae bacterium]|jgi:phosphohistidine phosphatase|nr:phosphohistidine phosphatase SixA [Anaerolineae bacterium]
MRVYFLRHGEADWPNWTGPDSDRPLTDKGIKEMKVIGEAIAGLKIELAAILTSPYRRASQTAEAIAHALNLPAKIEPSLEPGFDAAALGALIERQGGGDLMVVGHEPDFSFTIRTLTGGDVKMARAGFACVEIIDPRALRGELVWLIPPKIFKVANRT